MKNSCEVQDVGQKLITTDIEESQKESAERKALQAKYDTMLPKLSTVQAKSLSEKSDWESAGDGTPANKSRNFPGTAVPQHVHAKDSSSDVPEPTDFESGSDGNHLPAERSSGRKLRKAK